MCVHEKVRALTDRPSMSSLRRLFRSLASIVSNSCSPGALSAQSIAI